MSAPSTQYMSFFIGGEEYAVPLLVIREVVAWAPVTRMPTAPPCIRGVMNLRGSVVPVVDLAVKFGGSESPVGRWTCVVVIETTLEGAPSLLGVMVDVVGQVHELGPQDISPPPTFGTRIRADYLTGMGQAGGKFVLLLDAPRVLSLEELWAAASLANPTPSLAEGPTAAEARR